MAENEINFDEWLDGVQRTERSVTLYGRADLLADIDELEAQKRQAAAVPEEDRGYAESGAGKLQEKIDSLYIELDQSKMVFRVSFIDDEEQKELREAVKRDLKAELDEAAKAARVEAKEKCKRLEITNPNDVNNVARSMAIEATDAVVERELSIRTCAAAVVSPRMTPDQVRKLYSKVGDAQFQLLTRAYSRASNEAPLVAVPKSSRPTPAESGGTSS
jgi:flagellar hook-length control protein FliK